jgi:hypothetical protein
MKSLATTTVARLNPAVSGLPAPHNQILVPIVTTHTAADAESAGCFP